MTLFLLAWGVLLVVLLAVTLAGLTHRHVRKRSPKP